MNNQKIAVASKDGISINLHFGHAKTFLIYEVSKDQIKLLETRDVDQYCHDHTESESAMDKILKTIADCTSVMVAKIGDVPAERLLKHGIKAINEFAYEGIEPSLQTYTTA